MKIRGRTVSTTMPRSDWNQADPAKADYIKNKPTELEVVRGYSAYQVAVMNGFEGSEEAWLLSLNGPAGPQGKQGPQGEQGPAGATGPAGAAGATPQKGVDYYTEADKEEIVQEVLAQVPEVTATVSGIWSMNKMAYGSAEMGNLSQDIHFTTTMALYQTDEGLAISGTEDQLVSKHEVSCSRMEIQIGAEMATVQYTVESADETFMAFLAEVGSNVVPVFLWMSIAPAGLWYPNEAMTVDFGTAQKVSAEFKEAFTVLATQREEDAVKLASVTVTEHADGSVTMENTLSSGAVETIGINADATELTYNGKVIPMSWVTEGAQ